MSHSSSVSHCLNFTAFLKLILEVGKEWMNAYKQSTRGRPVRNRNDANRRSWCWQWWNLSHSSCSAIECACVMTSTVTIWRVFYTATRRRDVLSVERRSNDARDRIYGAVVCIINLTLSKWFVCSQSSADAVYSNRCDGYSINLYIATDAGCRTMHSKSGRTVYRCIAK